MERVDYTGSPNIRFPDYMCEKCKKSGVKLWRLGNLFGPLLCFDHAVIRANDRHRPRPGPGQPAPRVLGSAMMVAAIPSEVHGGRIESFWSAQRTPAGAWRWWDSLPI